MFTQLSALFFSAFTSATVLPGTSEIVLLALLAQEIINPGVLLFVATVGNVSGSIVNWVLGRFFQTLRDRKWFPVSAEAYVRAEEWYGRYGVWSLLLAWIPIVGDPITVVAGAMRIGFLKFVLLVTVSKFGRYCFVLAGYYFWTDHIATG